MDEPKLELIQIIAFVHAGRINLHSLTKGWISYVQKPLLSQKTEMIV